MRAHTCFASALATVAAAQDVQLLVGVTQTNLGEMDSLFWKVADPKSAEFSKHRTAEELASLVGSAPESVERTQAWLRSIGCTQIELLPNKDTIRAVMDKVSTLAQTQQNNLCTACQTLPVLGFYHAIAVASVLTGLHCSLPCYFFARGLASRPLSRRPSSLPSSITSSPSTPPATPPG
jgi:hypothetical protein